MKSIALLCVTFSLVSLLASAQNYPVNDLTGAPTAPGTEIRNPASNRDYTPANCDDLTIPIAIQVGIASANPGSPERVGTLNDRIFRDAIASTCPGKAWPGSFGGGPYAYSAIQFSNCSGSPVCVTVNVNLDGGSSPCGSNAHGYVYQSADGADATPFDPANIALNFLGDQGSSLTQPFSVTVNPGLFEIVFINNFGISNCDVSFSITVPPGSVGSIKCSCESVPVSNWALLIGVLAIVTFTVFRFRKTIL
jgi:hypothetical protein